MRFHSGLELFFPVRCVVELCGLLDSEFNLRRVVAYFGTTNAQQKLARILEGRALYVVGQVRSAAQAVAPPPKPGEEPKAPEAVAGKVNWLQVLACYLAGPPVELPSEGNIPPPRELSFAELSALRGGEAKRPRMEPTVMTLLPGGGAARAGFPPTPAPKHAGPPPAPPGAPIPRGRPPPGPMPAALAPACARVPLQGPAAGADVAIPPARVPLPAAPPVVGSALRQLPGLPQGGLGNAAALPQGESAFRPPETPSRPSETVPPALVAPAVSPEVIVTGANPPRAPGQAPAVAGDGERNADASGTELGAQAVPPAAVDGTPGGPAVGASCPDSQATIPQGVNGGDPRGPADRAAGPGHAPDARGTLGGACGPVIPVVVGGALSSPPAAPVLETMSMALPSSVPASRNSETPSRMTVAFHSSPEVQLVAAPHPPTPMLNLATRSLALEHGTAALSAGQMKLVFRGQQRPAAPRAGKSGAARAHAARY